MLGKSFNKYLGSMNPLGKMLPRDLYKKLEQIFSPCCGIGQKDVRIKNSLGNHTSLSLPFTYSGKVYNSFSGFEDDYAKELGYGYVVYVSESKRIIHVLSNKSKKDTEGLATAPNFITLD
jgi:hypothetical protein